jgi:hypothetical protein
MSNNLECALEGDEAYGRTDAWEIGGISMQGVYASQEDRSCDDDDDDVDETNESKAGPALGGWSFATQADVASAACVGGHHRVTPNQSASAQTTRKPPSRPMTAPVNNNRQPGQHGSMPRRGALRPGGSVRVMPGPMAGARRSPNVTDGDSAKIVARASASRGHTSTTTSLVAGQGAGKRNEPAVANSINTIVDEQVETKPEQVETKTEQVEAKTEHVETKTEQVDTKTEHNATTTMAVDTTTKHVETITEQGDTTTQHGEDADCIQLVYKEATLCQKVLKQDKHESVHEMKETRQHDEGKQACNIERAEQCETIPSPNNQATVSVGVSLEGNSKPQLPWWMLLRQSASKLLAHMS